MFEHLAASIDRFTQWTGERLKWLMTILVLMIFGDVLLRYWFATSKAWITDLEWHVFSLIFLLAAAFTLKADQHVRVDVFYAKWKAKRQAWTNLVGTVFLLLPWCLIVIITSFEYAGHSFAVREQSSEPGGLHARYLIKASIILGFGLLLLQAISVIISSIRIIRNTTASS